MFTREMLIEMLTIQNELNCGMAGTSWLTSDNKTRPFYRAAYLESAEGIDHYGWKWWKKFDRSTNIGQVKLEVVDMLLFVLSDELRTVFQAHASAAEDEGKTLECYEDGMPTQACVNQVIELAAQHIIGKGIIDLPETTDEDLFVLVSEQFIAQTIIRRSATVRNWGALADALNLTLEEAGLWYIGKCSLNFLRDGNGQKEGTYVKNWWGVEDNIYLERLINAIRAGSFPIQDGDLRGTIFAHLQEQYRRLMSGESALEV